MDADLFINIPLIVMSIMWLFALTWIIFGLFRTVYNEERGLRDLLEERDTRLRIQNDEIVEGIVKQIDRIEKLTEESDSRSTSLSNKITETNNRLINYQETVKEQLKHLTEDVRRLTTTVSSHREQNERVRESARHILGRKFL